MSSGILAIVLCAAILHASWNALVKGAEDRLATMALVSLGHVLPGAALAIALPLPDPSAWPFIAGSTAIHWIYYFLLIRAYRTGDLSVVYPIARGLAPILVAAAAWWIADEELGLRGWLGVIAVSAGVLLIARPSRLAGVPPGGLLAATGTAITIAVYSVLDGIGVRVSGDPLAYIAWLFVLESFFVAIVFGIRPQRALALNRRAILIGIGGGIVSAVAYAMALWAKAHAPLGLVSAARETSVIFAALLGLYWFGERPRAPRLVAAAVVLLGLVLVAGAGTSIR